MSPRPAVPTAVRTPGDANGSSVSAGRLLDQLWDRHVIPGASPVVSGAATYELPDLLYVDLHLVHESTSAQAFTGLRDGGTSGFGTGRVRRPDLSLATADHTVATGIRLIPKAAVPDMAGDKTRQTLLLEHNAHDQRIEFRGRGSGRQGIVHIIAPEAGLIQPGMTAVCGDSHTSTLGAFGALALGVGTTAVEQVLATQTLWLTRPKVLAAEFSGKLSPGVEAKDMVLALIQRIGTAGAQGHAIEFCGEAVRAAPMEARMTLCNMAPEAGARAAMVGPDDVTFGYLQGREFAPRGALWDEAILYWSSLGSTSQAVFDTHVRMDSSRIKPMVTWGTNPAMSSAIDGHVPYAESAENPAETAAALAYMGLRGGERLRDLKIDVVFIGSCTNARLADLRSAARILGNSKIARGVRAIVVPGSEQVAAQAEREGLRRIFESAGFEWGLPGCSMCVAMNGDQVAAGQRCAATSNRNFRDRQGPGARTHLVSPSMAAAAALTGSFTDVRELA
jgi:3-isopropylmalate/(R)-2-methylmalate dehydratase large subunit